MRCPFPGMDPYLERSGLWRGFHTALLVHIQNQLAAAAPDDYDVGVEEQLRVVATSPENDSDLVPDMAVSRDPAAQRSRPGRSGAAVLEPIVLDWAPTEWEEVRYRWLEVRRLPENQLVTMIEILSPWNKRGDGFAALCRKRRLAQQRGVHWVEIDLLVGGRRAPMKQPRPPCDFFALVARKESPAQVEVYGWSVRDPLPTVPIPLRTPDPDLPLDLAEAFRTTYEQGVLDRSLRRLYRQPPEARFAPADRAWAAELAGAGR